MHLLTEARERKGGSPKENKLLCSVTALILTVRNGRVYFILPEVFYQGRYSQNYIVFYVPAYHICHMSQTPLNIFTQLSCERLRLFQPQWPKGHFSNRLTVIFIMYSPSVVISVITGYNKVRSELAAFYN